MPVAWLDDWDDRIRTIASNLLTLEVNTVVKNGMVAQKMPEVPVALHTVAQLYADFVADHSFPVTPALIQLAARRILGDKSNSADPQRELHEWATAAVPANPLEAAPFDPADELTNGPEAFEALNWASLAARNAEARAVGLAGPNGMTEEAIRQRQSIAALLSRIQANCRQLREVAILLETRFLPDGSLKPIGSAPTAPGETATPRGPPDLPRLEALMKDGKPDVSAPRLFGGTLGQTTQALFHHPRPKLAIDPDLSVLVRKAWDIGLEEVRFQTAIQVDGDVLVRVTEIDDVFTRSFLQGLHRSAVDDGLKQWRTLFEVAGDLIRTVGEWLFGPKKASG